MKKAFAFLLSVALVICMIPSMAFAEGEVTPVALSTQNVKLSKSSAAYTGANLAPTVTVSVASATDGVDYEVSMKKGDTTVSNIIETGEYKIVVSPKAGSLYVTGTDIELPFTVEGNIINYATVDVATGMNLINTEDFAAVTSTDASGKVITKYNLKDSSKDKIVVKLGTKELVLGTDYLLSGTIPSARGTSASLEVVATGTNFKPSSKPQTLPVYNAIYNDATTAVTVNTADVNVPYKNAAYAPRVTVQVSATDLTAWTTLRNGTDYTVEYYNDPYYSNKVTEVKDAQYYYVKIVGKGTYKGYCEAGQLITVTAKSIDKATSFVVDNAIATATPNVTITDGTRTLVEGVDYLLGTPTITKDATTTASGTGEIVVSGIGNYTNTKTLTYKVVDESYEIASATMESKTSVFNGKSYLGYYYNGAVQVPTSFTVKAANGKTLTASDYTVKYAYENSKGETLYTTQPKDAMRYMAIITGKGNYAGTATLYYTIEKYPLNEATVSVSQASATATPSVTVKSADGKITFASTDYIATTPSIIQSTGAGRLTVIATGEGNLSGSKYVEYSIVSKAITSCSITAQSTAVYTGASMVPEVSVYDGSTKLNAGTAYTVSYKDANGNVLATLRDAGTYTITITGINGYTGSATRTFTITGKDFSGANVTLNTTVVEATGYNVSLPAITSVKIGTATLSSLQYKFSYQNSDGVTITAASLPGTYYVVVVGSGEYTGMVKVPFEIKGTDQVINMTSDSLVKKYRNSADFSVAATCGTSALTYTSSDGTIAIVTSEGNVSMMGKAGVATITIKAPAAGKYNEAVKTVTVVSRPYKAKVSSVSSPAEGKLKAYVTKQSGCVGYQVVVSKSSSFKKGTRFFKKISNNPKYATSQSVTYTGLNAGKYYVKARAMYIDAEGNIAYGNYGTVKTVTVK